MPPFLRTCLDAPPLDSTTSLPGPEPSSQLSSRFPFTSLRIRKSPVPPRSSPARPRPTSRPPPASNKTPSCFQLRNLSSMLVVVSDLNGNDAVADVKFPTKPTAPSSQDLLLLCCFRPFLFFLFLLFLLRLSFNLSFNHLRAGSGCSNVIKGRV